MTIFAAALRHTGLSTDEAADYLSEKCERAISAQTVRDMSSGRSKVGPGVWDALRELYFSMLQASEAALDVIDEQDPEEVTFTQASKRSSEWPSQRVHLNVLALVALQSDIVVDD